MVGSREDLHLQETGPHGLLEDGDTLIDRRDPVFGTKEREHGYLDPPERRTRVIVDERGHVLPLRFVVG
jgi:hypothetical protein